MSFLTCVGAISSVKLNAALRTNIFMESYVLDVYVGDGSNALCEMKSSFGRRKPIVGFGMLKLVC